MRELAADVTLKPSSGGAYEVSVDGKTVFSKFDLKRFPKDGEIVGLLKSL